MKFKVALLLTLLMFLFISTAAANSLWNESSESIYQDRSAFEEGDIITVHIEENATALQSANTDTSQSSNVEADANLGIIGFVGSLLFGYSEEDMADGQTGREGNIEADITTQVVEIKENGNLRIEGTKTLTINEEDQEISLTGNIRPNDINLDNEIDSERVADAAIEYKGDGSIAAKQRPGLFSRLFNWLF